MSQLTDKKPRKYRGDITDPAVRYVRHQRVKDGLNPDALKPKPKDMKSLDVRTNEKNNFAEFYSMTTMSKQIASESWADKMARRMIDWVEQTEEALTLEEFYRSIGILSQDFCELANKYPVLIKALKYTKMIIGDRRERGMILRKFDPGSVAFMMPHYKESWKEMVTWRASLKNPEGSAATRMQYVVMTEMPSSDLVKPLVVKPLISEENGNGEVNTKDDTGSSTEEG